MTTSSQLNRSQSTTSPLKRAKLLYDKIVAAGDSIDEYREIPSDLIAEMKNANLLRLLVPQRLGGDEMDWYEYLDVIFTIAHADGSVGWCINQGNVFATNAAREPVELAKEIWGVPEGSCGNGPPIGATSKSVSGGYSLSGKWIFSSGCRHANWLAALVTSASHPPRLHFMPKDEIELIDNWQVRGLRGTGSFGFSCEDYFVPGHRVMRMDLPHIEQGPIYKIPQSLMFACGFGCVALGVARSGLDSVIELSHSKKPQFGKLTLAQDPVVQSKIGLAEGLFGGAKAFLYETVGEVWENVKANGMISLDERLRLRLAGTHAIRQSAQVVDIVYNLTGSNAIFESTVIQRKFQDIHVITQQIQGRESHYQTVGAHLLGESPEGGVY
ncbi:MAG: acyl-CoA dehydrogenase family protein [Gammaproteobacteria bacterium]|nr:acyl-CoA dehydrogenase family protein [Gammaproteobacteria bacterium]